MLPTIDSPVELPRPASPAKVSASGIWIALFAISMSFAAFTSALIIREASPDWTHIAIPRIVFGSSAVLLLSSLSAEMSRREIGADAASYAISSKAVVLVAATLCLGLAFVGGQYLAWRNLASRGLYVATNPNSSFFYLLTGAHAICVLGGIAAMGYLLAQLVLHRSVRRTLVRGVVIYWHFMTVLWFYLLIIVCSRL